MVPRRGGRAAHACDRLRAVRRSPAAAPATAAVSRWDTHAVADAATVPGAVRGAAPTIRRRIRRCAARRGAAARPLRQLVLDCRLGGRDPHRAGGDRPRRRISGRPATDSTRARAIAGTASSTPRAMPPAAPAAQLAGPRRHRRSLPGRRRPRARRAASCSISTRAARRSSSRWPARRRLRARSISRRGRGGGVWLLDRPRRRYWALDRHFVPSMTLGATPLDTIDPGTARRFSAARAGAGPPHRARVDVPCAGVRLDAIDPVAIEGAAGRQLLILDRRAGGARACCTTASIDAFGAAAVAPAVRLSTPTTWCSLPPTTRATPRGQALRGVARRQPGVRASTSTRRRTGCSPLRSTDRVLPDAPVRRQGLIAAARHALYDFVDGWIPLVAAATAALCGAPATLLTPPFDGREPDCVWHRLMLDACIPPDDVACRCRTRAADDEVGARESTRVAARARSVPAARRLGAARSCRTAARRAATGTWELLFQRARGRYLQVELTLAGNGRATPRLRALRAYYPRFSYLRTLPARGLSRGRDLGVVPRSLPRQRRRASTRRSRIALRRSQMLFDVRSAPPRDARLARQLVRRRARSGVGRSQAPPVHRARDGLLPSARHHARAADRHPPRDRRLRRSDDRSATGRAAVAASIRFASSRATARGASLPVVAGDPTEETSDRAKCRPRPRWRASEGRSRLNERYREFLRGDTA